MKNAITDYHVRNCGRKDHLTLLDIDRECFGRRCLNASDLDSLFKRCYCLVAVFDGMVVGYLIYEKNRNDATFVVQRMAVSPQYRNGGAATNLLNKLSLSNKDMSVRVKVREQSLDFQMFLKGRGFKAIPIGHRKIRQENSTIQKPYYIEERSFDNGDASVLFERSCGLTT